MSSFFIFWWISVSLLTFSLIAAAVLRSWKDIASTGALLLIALAFGGEVYMHDQTRAQLAEAEAALQVYEQE